MKALGTGWGGGLTFYDIEVRTEDNGQPLVTVSGGGPAPLGGARGSQHSHQPLARARQRNRLRRTGGLMLRGTSRPGSWYGGHRAGVWFAAAVGPAGSPPVVPPPSAPPPPASSSFDDARGTTAPARPCSTATC